MFDAIYEEILIPLFDWIIDMIADLADMLLFAICLFSFPLWIVPYAIIKHKRKRRETDVQKD